MSAVRLLLSLRVRCADQRLMAPSRSSGSVDGDEKTGDEKRHYVQGVSVTTEEVDSGAKLSVGFQGVVDPKEAERIR